VRLDRAATLSVFDPLRQAGLLRGEPGIPILMYHSISEDNEARVAPYYRLCTSPGRFREQMQWLHDRGYVVIDLEDAIRRVRSGTAAEKPFAVLTFDDGFHELFTEAWPAMAKFGFTGTVFLPTAFIGRNRGTFKGRGCLTWNEVRELSSRGIRFGSHTVNHPKLHALEWPEIRRELAESKATLEQELQMPVRRFAYPYAFPQEDRSFVSRLKYELLEMNYAVGVTTMIGRASSQCDPLCARRVPVNDCDDEALFLAKLDGSYDWLAIFQKAQRVGIGLVHGIRNCPSRETSQ